MILKFLKKSTQEFSPFVQLLDSECLIIGQLEIYAFLFIVENQRLMILA